MWPRGPMDKASAYGAGDCRFESCRGHSFRGGAPPIAHMARAAEDFACASGSVDQSSEAMQIIALRAHARHSRAE